MPQCVADLLYLVLLLVVVLAYKVLVLVTKYLLPRTNSLVEMLPQLQNLFTPTLWRVILSGKVRQIDLA